MRAALERTAKAALLCALLALPSCGEAPEGWTPVLEHTSTTSLRAEADTAAQHLRQARELLAEGTDSEAAQRELTAAESSIANLVRYYLPLLEARERAYNAYRHYYLGEVERSTGELDEVEAILLGMAQGDELLLRELETPLGRLEDARAGVATGSTEAPIFLQALARELDALLIKGGLVLAGS